MKVVAHGLRTQALTDRQDILEEAGGDPERDQRGLAGFQPQQLRRRVVRKQFSQRAEGLGATALAATAVVSRASDRDDAKDGPPADGVGALAMHAAFAVRTDRLRGAEGFSLCPDGLALPRLQQRIAFFD